MTGTGVIIPVVEHFGSSSTATRRWARGHDGAMRDARDWFGLRLGGPTITVAPTIVIDVTKQGRTRAQFEANPWGEGLGAATRAGLPVWHPEYLVSILVAGLPYTLAGFGGAAWNGSGATVKDGDLLELISKKHAGEAVSETDYSQQVAVIIHELMHGMGANSHDNVPGDNVEWEWWAGLAAGMAPVNRDVILAGPWVAQPPASGGSYDEGFAAGREEGRAIGYEQGHEDGRAEGYLVGSRAAYTDVITYAESRRV